ncbi:hypothetical protein IF2G_09535 [Cordyceps javanica]|nr:hypothetical protein IF2G_09535 [Cordyceps javanica]
MSCNLHSRHRFQIKASLVALSTKARNQLPVLHRGCPQVSGQLGDVSINSVYEKQPEPQHNTSMPCHARFWHGEIACHMFAIMALSNSNIPRA